MSVNIFSYAGLLVSLWFKSQAAWNLQMPAVSPMYYWIAFGTGFTVEYIFVFIISNFITQRSHDTLKDIYASNRHIKTIQNKMISSFANLVEGRDSFTGEHIKRTAIYVELISRELVSQGYYKDVLTEENIQLFINTAPLHDLGKIRIPDQILCKPSGFTQEEYEIMKTHSYEGYKLIDENLSEIESEEFLEVAKIMSLYHHEKWDGTGYPNKVKGYDIPLCARIMAAADVLDALLSKRQYKAAMSLEQALDIFEKSRGSHFEPCIVDAVFACQDKIRKIAFPD
jgi:HD-GYP domain-containing protein (c-di-GMP phosphodiesterase class II)